MTEETIQEIYEKAFEEEYDNILIRDMQMRIENKIYDMAHEYLEKLGLTYDYDSERFEGKINCQSLEMIEDLDDEFIKPIEDIKYKDVEVEYKLTLILKYPDVRIESDNPEFSWN